MVTVDIAENDLIELLKEFEIFERNRISLKNQTHDNLFGEFSLSFSLSTSKTGISHFAI